MNLIADFTEVLKIVTQILAALKGASPLARATVVSSIWTVIQNPAVLADIKTTLAAVRDAIADVVQLVKDAQGVVTPVTK